MNKISLILHISRPRFWLYLGGTYLIGSVAGAANIYQIQTPLFLINLIYFLIPANIFLYGVNDLFDADTDKLNPKKGLRENILKKSDYSTLVFALAISLAAFFIVYFLQTGVVIKMFHLVFLVLAFFYSASPIRFKSIPILDSLSNILYAVPAFLGFFQFASSSISADALLAALCWTSSMHLFSAIPDIPSDKKSGILTSAVFFGEKYALVICTGLWFLFCLIVWTNHFLTPFSFILIVYPLIPLFLRFFNRLNIAEIYWWFPYVNGFIGFSSFVLLASNKW